MRAKHQLTLPESPYLPKSKHITLSECWEGAMVSIWLGETYTAKIIEYLPDGWVLLYLGKGEFKQTVQQAIILELLEI